MRGFLALTGVAALFSIAVACPARAETLPIQGIYPAGNDGLSALNSVAMGRFSGSYGDSFAIALEQWLRDANVRGSPYFNVVSAPASADATVRGSATDRYESRNELQPRQICDTRDAKGKCIHKRTINITCTRRMITLNYTLSVDGRRGQRLYLIEQSPQYSDAICPDTSGEPTVDSVIRQMVAGATQEIRLQFAPFERRDDIRVKEGVEGLKGSAKGKFKDAIKMTKRNVSSACDGWTEVDELVPNHAPTLFNLGLCAESRGDYNTAEALYKRVADIDRSEKYATDGLLRLDLHRHAERQLAERQRAEAERAEPQPAEPKRAARPAGRRRR